MVYLIENTNSRIVVLIGAQIQVLFK